MITHDEYLRAVDLIKRYQKQLEAVHLDAGRVVALIDVNSMLVDEDPLNKVEMSYKIKRVLDSQWRRLGLPEHPFRNARVKDLENMSMKAFLSCAGIGEKARFEMAKIARSAKIKMKP